MQISPDSVLYYVVVLLIYGNIFALAIGVLMLVSPKWLNTLFQYSNRWISTRRMTKPLEKPRPTERVMLRYPRLLGAILLASAALILIKGAIFITGMSAADGGRLLAGFYTGSGMARSTWEVLWIGLVVFIVVGTLLAIVVGLMSLFTLDKLKRWLERVNRWVSTREATKPLDTPHYPLDTMIQSQPRLWGGLITALALFTVLVLAVFVLGL